MNEKLAQQYSTEYALTKNSIRVVAVRFLLEFIESWNWCTITPHIIIIYIYFLVFDTIYLHCFFFINEVKNPDISFDFVRVKDRKYRVVNSQHTPFHIY